MTGKAYTSKAGKTANYKIKASKGDRVLLESFGSKPVQFWTDKSKLLDPLPIKDKPGDETRKCWECGCYFTWAQSKNQDGDWAEYYCGC